MEFLSKNTRHNARYDAPTDFELERITREKFASYISNQDYFNSVVTIITERNTDMEIRGNMVRLTTTAVLDNCGEHVANFQRELFSK